MRTAWLVSTLLLWTSLNPRLLQAGGGSREIVVRGDFLHPAGVPFPERVGPFHRTDIFQFDREGFDLAAGYEFRSFHGSRILVTFYVYPIGDTDLTGEFQRWRQAIENESTGRLTSEKDISLGGGSLSGRHGAFVLSRQWLFWDVPLASHLVVARWNAWWIKWRISYLASGSPQHLDAALRLIDELTPAPTRPGVDPEEEALEVLTSRLWSPADSANPAPVTESGDSELGPWPSS